MADFKIVDNESKKVDMDETKDKENEGEDDVVVEYIKTLKH